MTRPPDPSGPQREMSATGFSPAWLAEAHVRDLTADSREASPARAFVAYPGGARDGRNFISDAIARGAPAVIWEKGGDKNNFEWRPEWRVPNVAVVNLKEQTSAIAAEVFGHPSRHLWMVGVTGTNGKTSTRQWIAQSFERRGRKSAVIGTLGMGLVGQLVPISNTTPDAIVLQRALKEAREAGATACAMEVSSHGLDQGRVSGIKFDVALFTNLTRDHLDYHGTMQAYGEAKAKLFASRGLRAGVVNVDDEFGADLDHRLRANGLPVVSYGIGKGDLNASIERLDTEGMAFTVSSDWGVASIRSPLLGRFNVHNLLGVLGVLLASDVPFDEATQLLAELRSVDGRMQTVGVAGQPKVVVDYAHTPDALEKALATLSATLNPGSKLICVFGCGGDRDRGKRPVMGEIAARHATRVIVTSDNPRTEPPHQIIDDILAGMGRADRLVIEDRRAAIHAALREAEAGDVILIAGKGHEDYQEIQGVRHAFSDAEVARAALESWRAV
jgi:UDP-N-acetylmuramoyl-L-alanyl-D-glutamate--2,6-diaminopimelate ligase